MKRILFLLLAAALCLATPALAGLALDQIPSRGAVTYFQLPDGTYAVPKTDASGNPVLSGSTSGFTQLGYQQITALSASTALTVPDGAKFALVVAEGKDVRWRPDGSSTAPTASVGMPLSVGQPLLYGGDLSAIRFIEQSASAKLNVLYGK